MNNYTTIFSRARILTPSFSADPAAMGTWAVIACDQFTSEPDYWRQCERIIGDAPSALGYVMPEAWLGTAEEARQAGRIRENMASFRPSDMRETDGFIYVERTLPDGSLRRGIVGCADLEAYDYAAGSTPPVRATEGTVLERIPPRQKVRAEASVEFPHILVLADDRVGLFDRARVLAGSLLYDFDLMQGGGHIRGWAVSGTNALRLTEKIGEYEASMGDMIYAVGDGNHSLAAAKAHWEKVKSEGGGMTHPARYALCEITPLGDESLRFEPIYRVVKNCDPADLAAALVAVTGESAPDGQTVTLVTKDGREARTFLSPTHALTVGSLQDFIDRYTAEHPGTVCDYIHGEDSLVRLAQAPDAAGFLFGGMDKEALFPYVRQYGRLPRKTFSMGEAESKRYYLEAREILR